MINFGAIIFDVLLAGVFLATGHQCCAVFMAGVAVAVVIKGLSE